MEVPRIGVKVLAYASGTAMPDRSYICKLHHSSRQRCVLNPLSRARDQTHILMDTKQDLFLLSHNAELQDADLKKKKNTRSWPHLLPHPATTSWISISQGPHPIEVPPSAKNTIRSFSRLIESDTLKMGPGIVFLKAPPGDYDKYRSQRTTDIHYPNKSFQPHYEITQKK